MITEKILDTRIQLKYDTLENWNASTFNLKKGEVAFVEVPTVEGATLQPIMFKVGTGDKKFSELDWVSAKAADVYGWAKKSQADFETYVKGLVNTDLLGDYYTEEETDALLKTITDRLSTLEGKYDVDKKLSVVVSELEGKINAVDTGVMDVTGTDAIQVTGEDEKTIALVIDPTSGNVALTQSATGLKANVDLSNYATKSEIRTDDEIKTIAATEVNTLIGGVSDADTITNITSLIEYVNANGGEIIQLKEDVETANTNASNAVTVAGNANTTAGQALDKANEALEGAEGAAASAQAAATAQGKAEEAQAKAEAAQDAAEEAQTKAENARDAAETAQNNATDAKTAAEEAKEGAETARDAASGFATAAETKAGEASASAQAAATSASQASTSAQQAETFSANALEYADSAEQSKESAQSEAEKAVGAQNAAAAARDEAQNILTQVTDAATGAQATANEAKNLATTANTNAANAVTTANEAKATADTALQEITTTANGGLKVTNKNQIDIDTNVVFVLNCGSATEVI